MRQAQLLLVLSTFVEIAIAQQYSSYITAVIYGKTVSSNIISHAKSLPVNQPLNQGLLLYGEAFVSWIYTPLSSYPAPTAPASSSPNAEPTSVDAQSSLVSAAISAASSSPASSQQPVTVSVRETVLVTTPAPQTSEASNQPNGGGAGAVTSAPPSQAPSRTSDAGTAAGAGASSTAGAAAVTQNRSDGGLSTGAIVGIAVGVGIFGLLLLLGLLFFCLRRRKRRKQEAGASSASSFNEEPKVAPMVMANSDSSLMKDDEPPANSHAREPTLPNVGEIPPGSSSGAPIIPPVAMAVSRNNDRNPFMGANEQPAPITNAVPVHSGSEAAAVVADQGANRPWKPTNPNPPPRQSPSANSMAGFDFGIGNQNRMPHNPRHSIPRRPVGGDGY